MSDALNPKGREWLSSRLDHEIDEQFGEALVQDNFTAQVHYRNLESVSRATQQAGIPAAKPADDFLSRIMGAIDGLEQQDPAEDFEVLSAHYDGEWELESETLSTQACDTQAWMQTLGQAMRQLPVPAPSADFVTAVMHSLEQVVSPGFETVSALYDQEFSFSEARCLQGTELPATAQTYFQNCQTLSSALKALPTPACSQDFAQRVLAALPAEAPDFESLSAYYDQEVNLKLTQPSALLQNFVQLSASLAALPVMQAPAGFLEQVMQAVDELDLAASQPEVDFETLSAAFDGEAELDSVFEPQLQPLDRLSAALAALPQPEAPADFALKVMQAIESDFAELSAHYDGESSADLTETQQAQQPLLVSLSTAFAQLPEFEAAADFAAKVMQKIEALPSFEDLSAHYDGELKTGLNVSEEQMQPLRALSQALAALPQPQAPADFVARVMLATEQHQKAKLFALPGLFKTRLGQVAAGLALFGMLALSTQLLQPTGPGTTVAVTEQNIVPVQYQAEDMLFSNPEVETVIGDTLELEQTPENDYNLWIGG